MLVEEKTVNSCLNEKLKDFNQKTQKRRNLSDLYARR